MLIRHYCEIVIDVNFLKSVKTIVKKKFLKYNR